MNLTEQIVSFYHKLNIQTKESTVSYVNPIIELDEELERGLLSGDGQTNPNEYKQVNSSTGLAVNYYMILNELGQINELEFEDKVAKPLLGRGGMKANIDVSYKDGDKTIYVESKFLEPYYSGNETLRTAYYEKDRYDVPEEHKDAWYSLLSDSNSFSIYNYSQLCRHLLAIWRKHMGETGPIELHSVTWRMTDIFINDMPFAKDRESYIQRRELIEEESIKCQSRINNFLEEIGWHNMSFKVLHYNDMLKDIEESSHYKEFCKRYFL